MKHARPDYDRIQDPAGLIPQDEPVFLLRAQDENAPLAVRNWARIARANGANRLIVEAAENHADAMIEWQQLHGSKKPDMPSPDDYAQSSVEGSHEAPRLPRKQSSPELSSRAAAGMSLDNDELRKFAIKAEHQLIPDGDFNGNDTRYIEPQLTDEFCNLFRSLCASVVSQDETRGQR